MFYLWVLMVELVITEKPNASKRIADALADRTPEKKAFKGVPYYELTHDGKEIIVGCAVGHLFGLAEKKKSKGFAYPVFDIKWVPAADVSKTSAFSRKYLDTLKKIAKNADSFVVATDYDVEGEVIGLNIVRYACKQKDARRMKFSTLTKDELVDAYAHASESIDWGQAEAGETRHFLDYFYGINVSRALTSAIKKAGMFKILSTGRVQGPALKIVVDREREIQKFKSDPFWQLELVAKKNADLIHAWHVEDKFWKKDDVDVVLKKVEGATETIVADVSTSQYKQKPPVPFDLTSLQTESYRCFGLNPKRTLEIAQDLYTRGLISYPRTSSQQLSEKLGFKKILNALAKRKQYTDLAKQVLKTKLVPNNGKKSDPAHPAIYPTGLAPKSIDEKKEKVYDLVVKRFFAVFGEPAVRERMKITLEIEKEEFAAQGTRTVEPNWHVFYAPYVKLEEIELPEVKKAERLAVSEINLKEDETKPPKRFTPASLIKALEKQGLGTKATRADIVETLTNRQYITGESIQVTELGMHTMGVLEKYCPQIIDAELTRHFEEDMEHIRAGKTDKDAVLKEAKQVLVEFLDEFKAKEVEIGEGLKETFTETRAAMTTVGKCMKCGEGMLILRRSKYGRFIACDKYPDCETTFKLPASGLVQVTKSVCPDCSFPMVKMIRKGKRPQEVCINLDCPAKTVEEDASGEPCPKCEKGKLILRKSVYGRFFACDQFPKCRFIKRGKSAGVKQASAKKAVKKTTKKKSAKKSAKKASKKAK